MSGDERESDESRTIGHTRLRAEPGPNDQSETARAVIVASITRLVLKLAREAAGTAPNEPSGEVPKVLASATKLASNAALGKLEAAGLQANLVQAQIADMYADARLKNAQAEEIEQRLATDRERAAVERVERVVGVIVSALGVPIDAAILSEGIEAALLGDGLTTATETRALADGSVSSGSDEEMAHDG